MVPMTASPPHLAHPKYRPDIDGLRAVAVLSVVAFHAFPAWMRGGFIGVDVFFVISGFLISTILFENLENGTFRFSEFYARRIKRIFPALLLVVVASFAFGWFVLMADEYSALGKHIAAGSGFVSNFVLWSESGYFDDAADAKPLLHLWSLGIEEQFYIVWPLVLWFAWKCRLALLIPALVIAVISLVLNINGIANDPVGTFYSPQSRFWELLCGSMLAWFTLHGREAMANFRPPLNGWWTRWFAREPSQVGVEQTRSNVLSLLGCLVLGYGFWRIDRAIGFPGKWASIPVCGTIMIIMAGPRAWINRTILSHKVVVWFGLISFPLYLWHWPLLSFARIVGGEVLGESTRIVAVVLSVFLAWLTLELIERPIRSGKLGKRTVLFLVLPMVVVGFAGFETHRFEGLPFRAFPKSYEAVLGTIRNSPMRDACHFAQTAESLSKMPCEYFFPNPSVAVVGNSHAVEIAYALAEELRPHNQGVAQYTMTGCPHNYLIGVDANGSPSNDVCVEWHTRVVASITRSPQLKYVVVSYRNEFYLDNAALVKALLDMMNALVAANKQVILVLQAPLPQKHIRDYLRSDYRRNVVVHGDVPGMSRLGWQTMYKHSAGLLEQLPASVMVIDPADDFCDPHNCYVLKNDTALYFDDNHISIEGARLIAIQVLRRWDHNLLR